MTRGCIRAYHTVRWLTRLVMQPVGLRNELPAAVVRLLEEDLTIMMLVKHTPHPPGRNLVQASQNLPTTIEPELQPY